MAEQVPTRDRLLEAAAKVIARDGYQGARLADVAREAGLTTGAIYSNFRDKQELFLAAFDHVQQSIPNVSLDEADLEAVIASVPEAIRQFGTASDLQILNLELALLGARDPGLGAQLRAAENESIERLAARLPEHLEDRRGAAALILALANGLAIMRMVGGDQVPVDGVVRAVRRLAGLDG